MSDLRTIFSNVFCVRHYPFFQCPLILEVQFTFLYVLNRSWEGWAGFGPAVQENTLQTL
jgi:hypothetical protein